MAIDTIKANAIFDGAVDTADLADGAVTSAKLDTNIDVAGTLDVTGKLTADSNLLVGSGSAVGNANANELELTNPAGSGTVGMTFNVNSGSADTGNIYWRSNAANNNIQIVGDPVSNYLAFATNGTEKMRILSSGGITFNGDTAATNALDDYEEGTWTPFLGPSGGSFTSQTGFGRYTKIGNIVHAWGYGKVTNVGSGSGGIDSFSGLPFASINDTFPAGNRSGLGTVREDQRTGYWGQLFISAGATSAAIQSPEGSQFMRSAGIATNDTFLIDLTYKTNA